MITAHRGASHDAPENTLAAFELAWKQDADAIEGDFCLCRDGEIVCIHDATTQRTAGVNLEVAKSTVAELKQLDVGRWKDNKFSGERIPTLQEVIATVPDGKRIVIELKAGSEIIAPLRGELEASKLEPEQIIVISFDEKTIAESKRLLPHIKTHWLTNCRRQNDQGRMPTATSVAEIVSRTNSDGLGIQANRDVINEDFIHEIRAAGVKEFHVWTVDDAADARFYQALGAYGITTNRPAFLRRELSQR